MNLPVGNLLYSEEPKFTLKTKKQADSLSDLRLISKLLVCFIFHITYDTSTALRFM
jgi:hypothetical protein